MFKLSTNYLLSMAIFNLAYLVLIMKKRLCLCTVMLLLCNTSVYILYCVTNELNLILISQVCAATIVYPN